MAKKYAKIQNSEETFFPELESKYWNQFERNEIEKQFQSENIFKLWLEIDKNPVFNTLVFITRCLSDENGSYKLQLCLEKFN